MNDLLAIGTVVFLKKYKESILIIGYKGQKEENGEYYDYIGCMMPLGYTSNQEFILFNAEDIHNISYIGYQSDKIKKVKRLINYKEKNIGMDLLLPIGSVVKIKNRFVKLFILGYIGAENGEYYEYIACQYPKGTGIKKRIYFNSDDIETIYFIGPQDKESIPFRIIMREKLSLLKKGMPEEVTYLEMKRKYPDKDWDETFELVKQYDEILKKEKEEEETHSFEGIEVSELHPFEGDE